MVFGGVCGGGNPTTDRLAVAVAYGFPAHPAGCGGDHQNGSGCRTVAARGAGGAGVSCRQRDSGGHGSVDGACAGAAVSRAGDCHLPRGGTGSAFWICELPEHGIPESAQCRLCLLQYLSRGSGGVGSIFDAAAACDWRPAVGDWRIRNGYAFIWGGAAGRSGGRCVGGNDAGRTGRAGNF